MKQLMTFLKLKPTFLAIGTVLLILAANAQSRQELCAFDQQYKLNKAQYDQAMRVLISAESHRNESYKSGEVNVIPVVVHVIHNGGAENISEAQIKSQIDVLNEDFGKATGTRGDGNGVDTKIRFALAKLTPDGKCTNGIVRIKSTLTNHKSADRNKLKELSFWDNKRYLNIYVVRSIDNGSGTLGYSSFPSGPDESDGVVVLHNAFGRSGTVSSPNNLGRTMSHEIGHWFGLYHTFQDGCGTDTCLTGDLICDTPPAANPNFGCPSGRNSCSNDGLPDQISNYMDYSDDACKSMFSAGQRDRMHTTLATFRTVISSPENVTSTGCDSGFVNGPCSVVADFAASGRSVCTGNSVLFTNKSLNGAKTFKWFFPGGSPDTSSVLNPTVSYATAGTYSVKLIAYDTLTSDTLEQVDYITVSNPPIGVGLPFYEGFEGPEFPPNALIIDNPDDGITWERDTVAVAYEGKASAKIDNLINTNYGQSDAIVLPGFDLTTSANTPYLRFRWAYARSDANYSDQLAVSISVDCGVNYTQIFTRTGSSLATGATQTTPYIPDSSTVWKEAKISLNSYRTSTNALIKIVNVTDGGNNLYVDDLKIDDLGTDISEIEGQNELFSLFPNPTEGLVQLRYTLDRKDAVSITVTDLLGRVLLTETEDRKPAGDYHQKLNISDLMPHSVYLVKLKIGETEQVRKLVVW